MVRRKKVKPIKSFRAIGQKMRTNKVAFLLEENTLEGLRKAKTLSKAQIQYHWQYYFELAQQRTAILDEIKKVLLSSSIENYKFEKWQRGVKWKYSLHPLSAIGSSTFIGQRFNIGKEVNPQLSSFMALYLARDKNTCLQETLGQLANGQGKMTPQEIAFSNPQSSTLVSVSGELESIFDLTDHKNLSEFVDLVKTFQLSQGLLDLAKSIGEGPGIVKNSKDLLEILLDPNWREIPIRYEIPSNSLIFWPISFSLRNSGNSLSIKTYWKPLLGNFPRKFCIKLINYQNG